MQGLKKWNAKKKSLGYIHSEMGVNKNYASSSKNKLSEALQSTPTSKQKLKTNQTSTRTLGELYFYETNLNSQIEAPHRKDSAKALVNHNKAVSLLRVAIAEGGGKTDPKKNLRLNAAIKRAKEIGVTQTTLQQIIRKSKLISEARPIALLQIRYQRKAYIICTVLTRSQSEFQLQLLPTLKRHFAGFAPALHMFNSYSYIEALVPVNIGGDFMDMKKNVQRDAAACGALEAKIKDYETGTFRFRVDPLIVANVAASLLAKGYRIIDTAYDFTPKRFVDLNSQEREAYNNFLWKLRQIPEIDGMFDNVRNSVAVKLDYSEE